MLDTPDRGLPPCSPDCCSPVQITTLQSHPRVAIRMPIPKDPWVIGTVASPFGEIPQVDAKLQWLDTLGSWKARWGIGRSNYSVQPRLYAVGNPAKTSPVFVTANYKMSFDRLRSNLADIDGWILVLDTKGINVWCAAGKGTFGTEELIRRVEVEGLKQIVSHRRLILPQLGATGVSAHHTRERSGFHVFYGPVRAKDIPEFMQARMKATEAMRKITFTLAERAVLIPIEFVNNLKYALFAAACLLLLTGVGLDIYSLDRVKDFGITNAGLVLLSTLCGALLPALLLPWLPGRAFSFKGAAAGLLPAIGIAALMWWHPETFRNRVSGTSWMFIFPAVSSFLGMNFTGSSTYTSLSGVKKEMRVALPAQISVAVCGLVLWLVGLFI